MANKEAFPSSGDLEEAIPFSSQAVPSLNTLQERVIEIVKAREDQICKKYFTSTHGEREQEQTNKMLDFFIDISVPGPLKESFHQACLHDTSQMNRTSCEALASVISSFVTKEEKLLLTYERYKDTFPPQIWHCCKRLCFAMMAIDETQHKQMRDVLMIHNHAERCLAEQEGIPVVIHKRRKGVGSSSLTYVSKSRKEREAASGQFHGTARQEQLRLFGEFVMQVLPFLYGIIESPTGGSKLPRKLCTQAICCLLGVSRNFLYNRRTIESGGKPSDDDLTSIIDTTGIRMRQHRRNGVRVSCPPVESLSQYDCGFELPCFATSDTWALVVEYEEFAELSRELHPRHKENCFLINRLYDPYFNTTRKICNKAFAALYNVSEALIAEVRRAIHAMCKDASTFDRKFLKDGSHRYNYHRRHPINRYDDSIREKIEKHLDVVLRADPAGSDGESVCRVYSPEINTHEKLQETLKKVLDEDDEVDGELSPSTIQRMINSYLKQRNHKVISFTQSDHNACPTFKELTHSILQFTNEARLIQREYDFLEKNQSSEMMDQEWEKRLQELKTAHKEKCNQEDECVAEMDRHTGRDMRIREYAKQISDFFRNKEIEFRQTPESSNKFKGWDWCGYNDRASITHQDDMTKVDLPHFVVNASADITRWRFDVNAHVNAVTNDAIVFSHEKGMGSKNAALIVEEVVLEHLLRCEGESMKVIVSDNASVGKNWITTIALPQYLVDQGLADVVVIAFLENNHGKWLADMMFGQFQTRRRRQTLVSIDDLLSGFEGIKKKYGKNEGYALNPLASVDFEKVLWSLGYEVTTPKEFGFVKRNIHFAAACKANAKNDLPKEVREIFGEMLPDEPGMVRISTEPPSEKT